MSHRHYLFPLYSSNIHWSKSGVSDISKVRHSVFYVICDCKIGKDHETEAVLIV